jgi:hypothetical protein
MVAAVPHFPVKKQIVFFVRFPAHQSLECGGDGQRIIKYAKRIDIGSKQRIPKPVANIFGKAGTDKQQMLRVVNLLRRRFYRN